MHDLSQMIRAIRPSRPKCQGPTMNWDDVRIFLAVARAGQILGAARRLELNHATVSRRVAALEEALRRKAVSPADHRQRADAGRRALPRHRRAHGGRHDRRALRARRRRRRRVRHGADRRAGRVRRRLSGAKRLGALTALHPRTEDPAGAGAALVFAVAGARPISPSPSSGRPKAGWWRQSWSTIRLACSRRAPMPRRMACPQTAPNWLGPPADRLRAGPRRQSLARLCGRVQRRLGRQLRHFVGARPGRSGALGRRHRHPAHLHRTLACRSWCRSTRSPPIRRAYWLVYHEFVRPLRRVQTVANFISKAVERERALFA